MAVPGHRLDRMFNPKVVAVIGDKGPMYSWLNNNMPFKEHGGKLYSVQLDEKEIPGIEALGITNFKSLAEVPEPVDYALVAVPRQVAPYVLKDLIANDVGGAGFFTSGFAETGEELGIKLQGAIVEMAKGANFPVVGPNCMGLYLPKVGVRFSTELPVTDEGRIGFISQSGTHAIMFGLVASANGMYVSRSASFGNAVVLDVADYVDYLMQDDETDIIGMYVEGVRDGRRFAETLKEACKRKPVVVWKGGQTAAGTRATMSHTGSLATGQAVWEGLMRQCGAIQTNNMDETVDVMKALTFAKRPKGTRVGLMAQTGGQSVSITDAFAKAGFEVPNFTDETYAKFGEFFSVVGGSFKNPLDMAIAVRGDFDLLSRSLDLVEADPNVDVIIFELNAMVGVRQWRNKPELLEKTLDLLKDYMARTSKTFATVLWPAHEAEYVASIEPEFAKRGIPVFASFERAAAALKLVADYEAAR